jgi:signal recognition particle GTPase
LGFIELLEKFTDKEIDNPELVDQPAKERIARDAGKSIDDVNKMILYYKQSLIMQTWLQLK